MNISSQDLVRAVAGRRVHGPDRALGPASIDSRTLPAAATFFCLRGPRFDGHAFAETALASGAGVLVCDEAGLVGLPRAVRTGAATVLCVPDVEAALQRLAAEHRARFKGLLVGITGSSGKTTTKDFVAAVLATRGRTLATLGNQNNQLGVPLTLCRLTGDSEFAVVEMGTSGPGEIAALAALARPHIGLVTTVGAAHLEGLGGLAGVADEKGDLLRALPAAGVAIMPSDILYSWRLTRNVRARLVTVARGPGAGVRLLGARETANGAVGRISVDGAASVLTLGLTGVHNLENALLALACGLKAGVPLADALAALSAVAPARLRGELRTLPGGQRVLLDCYNANPASMKAALRTFAKLAPTGLVVLGDMLELGEASEAEHREMGAFVAGLGDLELVAVGPSARALLEAARASGMPESKSEHAEDAATATRRVAARLGRGRRAWVLLKGSRGVGLERVYEGLLGMAARDSVQKGPG